MLDDVAALSESDELLEYGVDELVIEAELDEEADAEDDILGGVDEQAELLDMFDEED